ncbi:MAG: DUF4115 domain-containing protein, partial [Pseudomonadota bacterium]
VASEPQIDAPDLSAQEIARPTAQDYQGGGALAAVAAQPELPNLAKMRRDGPISAINPADAGVFAQPEQPATGDAPMTELFAEFGEYNDGDQLAVASEAGLPPGTTLEQDGGIVLHATAEAWIRVYESDNTTVWQGTLAAGERYRLPEQVIAPMMRSGAAGATFVVINGIAYGPLGKPGSVARKVSLAADDVRNAFPEADLNAIAPTDPNSTEQRAEIARP